MCIIVFFLKHHLNPNIKPTPKPILFISSIYSHSHLLSHLKLPKLISLLWFSLLKWYSVHRSLVSFIHLCSMPLSYQVPSSIPYDKPPCRLTKADDNNSVFLIHHYFETYYCFSLIELNWMSVVCYKLTHNSWNWDNILVIVKSLK